MDLRTVVGRWCHVAGPVLQRLVTALLLLFLTPLVTSHLSLSYGQTGTASLSGTIVDRQGGLVPGAQVSIVNTDTNATITTKTNNAGVYNLPALKPGHYRMVVTKQGFKQIDLRDMTLNTQDSVNRNFTLDVGAASETIVVNANAEHMATDDPAVGLLVNRDFVENMPLNGRSLQDLIALAPGAVSSSSGLGQYSINGQHENANYFTVDGIGANLGPTQGGQVWDAVAGTIPSQTVLGTTQALASIDALQEFKIQTSGYAAEYGRQPGGQVSFTTRSGSNEVHGTLFDYFRNNVLDANDWFFKHFSIPQQPERQNDFGGTLGGPLVIPRLYDGKNKTFYFVSYEGLRLTEPLFSGVQDVPTIAFRNFAAPSVQPFLNAMPLPNPGASGNGDECAASAGPAFTFSCTAPWTGAYSSRSQLDTLNIRVDQVVGEKLQLFAKFANVPSQQSNPAVSTLFVSNLKMRSWTLGSTWKISAKIIDEFRFNFSSNAGSTLGYPVAVGGSVPYPRSLVIPTQYSAGGALTASFVSSYLPVADFIDFPTYNSSINKQRQFNVIDGVSLTSGNHSLKFGLDYRRLTPLSSLAEYEADYVFETLPAVQDGFADNIYILSRQKASPTFTNLSLFAQDHWRLSPRLTLDYGLRWEFNPAPGAADGLYPLALTTSNLATAQLAPPGTPQYHTVYHNVAPRLGFAYQVGSLHAHSTVVRGGFGIFYDTGQALGAAGYGGYPFSALNIASNVALPVAASAVAPPSLKFPLVPPYATIGGISDPHLSLPYTEQWNLSLDEALSRKNTLTISYVGNVGRRLLFAEYYSNATIFNPLFTSLNFVSNAASSNYNALQIQDQGYVLPGMQLVSSYTWAHAIDNSSTDSSQLPPLRGNSDNDIRQALNTALNYSIPGAATGRFAKAVSRGWLVASRLTVQSGVPIDVLQGTYLLSNGVQQFIRPDLVRGVPIYLHNVAGALGGWGLNPAAFSEVPTDPNTGAPLEEGNLGRNFIHGPNFWSFNMAVERSFPVRDRLQLLFRVDAFNLLNHPNAGGIDPCLCDSTFGISNPNGNGGVRTIGVPNQLYGMGAARSLQLMLKVQF